MDKRTHFSRYTNEKIYIIYLRANLIKIENKNDSCCIDVRLSICPFGGIIHDFELYHLEMLKKNSLTFFFFFFALVLRKITIFALVNQTINQNSNIMLNLKGILTVKDGVRSGTSKSTGKPWQSQWLVISHKDFEGIDHTFAMRAIKGEVISQIEPLQIGDEVEFAIGVSATARQWTDPDGVVQTLRGNDVYLHSIQKTTF